MYTALDTLEDDVEEVSGCTTLTCISSSRSYAPKSCASVSVALVVPVFPSRKVPSCDSGAGTRRHRLVSWPQQHAMLDLDNAYHAHASMVGAGS